MYRLCVKYNDAKLDDLADQKGYVDADEMCEDLALDKVCLLTNYVPLDITANHINFNVHTRSWMDVVYAIIRVNEAEFMPYLGTTTV